MSSSQYMGPHYKDKTVSRSSYLYHEDHHIRERRSLYWDGAQEIPYNYTYLFAARQDELLRSTTDPDVREDIKNHPVRISFAAFKHSSLFVSKRVPATEVLSSVIAASIHGYIFSHKNLSSGTDPSSLQQIHMKFRTHKVNVLSLVLVCKPQCYVN